MLYEQQVTYDQDVMPSADRYESVVVCHCDVPALLSTHPPWLLRDATMACRTVFFAYLRHSV